MDGLKDIWQASIEILRAMRITLKYFFRRPVTNQFPDEPVAVYPRFRGRHVLKRHENGLERSLGQVIEEHLGHAAPPPLSPLRPRTARGSAG